MVVPRRHLRIVVWNDADLPRRRTQIFHAGGRGSSVQNQVENGRNQKANFVCNNTEGSRNTSQGSLELSL